GTAYDFFMSMEVLHHPDEFGLRASWAAGVRSRLPAEERKFLEEIQNFLWVPMHWIHELPAPKDATAALWALRQIPPAERPLAMSNPYETQPEVVELFQRIVERRNWDKNDLDFFRSVLQEHDKTHKAKNLPTYLDWLARPDELGEMYLSALQSYYQAFFAEEEKRIAMVLREGLARAQELADELSLQDLIVELSQGVHIDELCETSEIVMIPGYWNTPLVVFPKIGPQTMAFMFGVRPTEMSLVPGEPVPDTLLRVLKAVADPTRLRILRYLSQETMTPAQLSRKLRLRAPTVTHHLSALRLAGLVHVSLETSGEKMYASRMEAIRSTCDALEKYLLSGSGDES
ncbi:MAG: ArsR/SmtB family transcription factor, partial [Anaerolineales bacterium]